MKTDFSMSYKDLCRSLDNAQGIIRKLRRNTQLLVAALRSHSGMTEEEIKKYLDGHAGFSEEFRS